MLITHKAGLAALLLTSALTANADFKNIRVTNFQGTYSSPQGSGSADEFLIPSEQEHNSPLYSEIEIFKGNENFQISIDSQDFLWEDVPSVLLEMQSLNWSDIDFNTASKRVSLEVQSLRGVTDQKTVSLSRANANCSHSGEGHQSFVENLLESCLNGTGRLRVASFNNEDKSSLLNKSELTEFIQALHGLDDKAPSTQQELEDIELDIRNNSFEARLKTKIIFNTTVKAEGKSYFDSDEKVIRLRIDKAKAGFLNVTDKVFEELEKKQGEKLRVERPWVFVSVGD